MVFHTSLAIFQLDCTNYKILEKLAMIEVVQVLYHKCTYSFCHMGTLKFIEQSFFSTGRNRQAKHQRLGRMARLALFTD